MTNSFSQQKQRNQQALSQDQGGDAANVVSHEDIARAAFTLYQERGSQDGQCERNWLDAEAQERYQRATGMPGTAAVVMGTRKASRRSVLTDFS